MHEGELLLVRPHLAEMSGGFSSGGAWILSQVLPLGGCVTVGKFLNFSKTPVCYL